MLLQESVVSSHARVPTRGQTLRMVDPIGAEGGGGAPDLLHMALAADDAMFNGSFEVTALGLLQVDAVKDAHPRDPNETAAPVKVEVAAEEDVANRTAFTEETVLSWAKDQSRPKEFAKDNQLYRAGARVNGTDAKIASENLELDREPKYWSPNRFSPMDAEYAAPSMPQVGVLVLVL